MVYYLWKGLQTISRTIWGNSHYWPYYQGEVITYQGENNNNICNNLKGKQSKGYYESHKTCLKTKTNLWWSTLASVTCLMQQRQLVPCYAVHCIRLNYRTAAQLQLLFVVLTLYCSILALKWDSVFKVKMVTFHVNLSATLFTLHGCEHPSLSNKLLLCHIKFSELVYKGKAIKTPCPHILFALCCMHVTNRACWRRQDWQLGTGYFCICVRVARAPCLLFIFIS